MTHRLVRGVAGAMPQGARCVELRLKPQLKANLPRWSVPIGRTRLYRGAADAPVCSGRGWSHAPGGWVCRAAAEAAAQSELGQCPQGGRGGRRRQCRGAADTPVCSGRGGSHAPGGSVCRAAAEAAARSRSSKRACVAHQQLPSDWSRAAATMTAGRFGAWLEPRPRGPLHFGVSSSGSSHHSALDTDQSHKSKLARA